MRKVAILAAAGWKAAGDSELCPPDAQECLKPLEGCPNALLPIGQGETVLSRTAGQLSSLGFEVWAGVGRIGCRYERWAASAKKAGYLKDTVSDETFALAKSESPWTKERISCVGSFAHVVEIADPDDHNCFHTYWKVMCEVRPGWDRLLLMHGDTLLRAEILESILRMPAPHIYVLSRKQDIFWLNEGSIPFFSRVVGQVLDIPIAPGNQVVYYLQKGGVPVTDHQGEDDWCDVDNPRSLPLTHHTMSYEHALEWIERERNA